MTTPSEDPIVEVLRTGRVVMLLPDDSLIFRFEQHLTQEEADDIRKRVAEHLPPGLRFLIVGKGIDISVLRQEAES